MNINPKQIAKMITEDPNEVVPSDHFDDTEDEYIDPERDVCGGCSVSFWPGEMYHCQGCGTGWCDECVYKSEKFDVEGYESFDWQDPEDSLQTDLTMMTKCPTCKQESWDY